MCGVSEVNARKIEEVLERFEEELGYPTKVVATGGLAKFIAPLCKRDMVIDDNLLLRGLDILYRRNQR